MKSHILYRLFAAVGVFGLVFSGAASAAPITKTLTVQVFQLCDDGGTNCASTGPAGDTYYAAEVNAIWAQAGIGVNFNFAGQIDSTHFSFLDDSVAGDGLNDLTGGSSSSVVNMYLVHNIAGAFGEGYLGAGGIAIAMDAVNAYNSGLGRIDTIAHEIGHNLGLVPASLGGDSGGHSTIPDYLMASGGIRLTPTSITDIAPNGLGYDILPDDQIALARTSSLLKDAAPPVPEPSSLALTGMAFVALGVLRRRRSA